MTSLYFTASEWHTILNGAAVDLNRAHELMGFRNVADEIKHMRDIHAVAQASKRHNVPLNMDGFTDSNNGCCVCGEPMHYSELDNLRDSGLLPDTCLYCQHDGNCPECDGRGTVPVGMSISRDRLDPPEPITRYCKACNSTGDYGVYMIRRGLAS